MFRQMGKRLVVGLITVTLCGGVAATAAAAAERLPKPAAPRIAPQVIRSDGFWGKLSRFLEPLQIIFHEGPRIDPLGILSSLPLQGSTVDTEIVAPR